MRLIDADKLNFEDVDFYSPDSTYEVDEVIDNAPTVNAIVIPEGATNEDILKVMFPYMPRQVIWSINTMMEAETEEDWAHSPYGGDTDDSKS